ncbi:hypothetical protein PsorP6_017585 [Peronosclerospora sorghi]|uniref:Uncharacterized protein n=1 Tax=Peronosclerospora sorghi TaxID=230839 RepID=A0ACC0WLL9_9STRA|nr:hypothetical protein PsorP6_017585 [Peronosclerospora sorghi]
MTAGFYETACPGSTTTQKRLESDMKELRDERNPWRLLFELRTVCLGNEEGVDGKDRLMKFSAGMKALRFELPVERVATSAVLDVALPFNDTTDSRVHFRSPRDAHVVTNRKHVRNAFVHLFQRFQQRRNSWNGSESADVMRQAARTVLADALLSHQGVAQHVFHARVESK